MVGDGEGERERGGVVTKERVGGSKEPRRGGQTRYGVEEQEAVKGGGGG